MIESKILGYISEDERNQIRNGLKRIQQTWTNDLRYYSESQMRQKIGRRIAQMQYPPKNINKYLNKFESDIFEITNKILEIGKRKWN